MPLKSPLEHPRRPLFQVSIDTTLLAGRLAQVGIGETISYSELSELIGRDVQNGARPCLNSARRRVLREARMLFDPIRGEGLKRLNDVEKVGTSDATFSKLRRTCARGIEKVMSVDDYNALPESAQRQYNAATSLLPVFAHQLKRTQIAKVEKAVAQALSPLSLQRTLEQFGFKEKE